MNSPLSSFVLLFPYARLDAPEELAMRMKHEAQAFLDWERLPEFAERQRMAPLFYDRARSLDINLPDDVRLQFQGLYLRHELASRARSAAICEILSSATARGLRPILLKGAAVAGMVYPHPVLRPMRDVDLLARPGETVPLHALLGELGYRPALPEPGKLVSSRHLEELSKPTDGFNVSVEVHDRLFDSDWRGPFPSPQDCFAHTRPFPLASLAAESLGPEELLWHVYLHMINEEIRLIGIADLILLAERFAAEIDWPRLRRACPGLLNALAIFHSLAPLSDELAQAARLTYDSPPAHIGKDLCGWPRIAFGEWRALGLPAFLQETFFPSDWWLRLHYGIKSGWPVQLYRWAIHPLAVLGLAVNRMDLRSRSWPVR